MYDCGRRRDRVHILKNRVNNIAWLGVLFLLGVLFFSSSCCKKEGAERIKITFLMWGTSQEKKQMDGWLKKFEEANPDIKVKCIHIPRGYTQKLLTMCAGGTPPDVMMVGTGWNGLIYPYIQKDIIYPLDEFIKKEENREWRSDIYKRAWEMFSWKGHIYAVPREINACAILYYNRDLFDKEKMSYPDESYTWEKLVKTAKRLTKKERGRVVQYGLWRVPWKVVAMSYGTKFVNESGEIILSNEEGIYYGLSLLVRAIQEEATPPVVGGEDEQSSFGDFWTSVLSGKIAMWFTGPWGCQELMKRASFHWDMALVPKGKRRVTPLTVVGYAIHKQAKNKEACFKLVKFLTSSEILKDFAYSGRSFPASKTAYKYYLKHPKYEGIVHKDIPFKSLEYGEEFLKSPYKLEILDILKRNAEDIILGNKNIKEGLSKIKREIVELLKEKKR